MPLQHFLPPHSQPFVIPATHTHRPSFSPAVQFVSSQTTQCYWRTTQNIQWGPLQIHVLHADLSLPSKQKFSFSFLMNTRISCAQQPLQTSFLRIPVSCWSHLLLADDLIGMDRSFRDPDLHPRTSALHKLPSSSPYQLKS